MDLVFLFDEELALFSDASSSSSRTRTSPRDDVTETTSERYARAREPRMRARTGSDGQKTTAALGSIEESVDSASGSVTIMYGVTPNAGEGIVAGAE